MVSERTEKARKELKEVINKDIPNYPNNPPFFYQVLTSIDEIPELSLLHLCNFYANIMQILRQETIPSEVERALDKYITSLLHDKTTPQKIFKEITT